MAAYKIIGF